MCHLALLQMRSIMNQYQVFYLEWTNKICKNMKIALTCPASLPATQFGGIMFLCVHIAKKLSISDSEFEKLLSLPNKSFKDYKTYYHI